MSSNLSAVFAAGHPFQGGALPAKKSRVVRQTRQWQEGVVVIVQSLRPGQHTMRSSNCNERGECGELGYFFGDFEGDLLPRARASLQGDPLVLMSGDFEPSRGARAERERSDARCWAAVKRRRVGIRPSSSALDCPEAGGSDWLPRVRVCNSGRVS